MKFNTFKKSDEPVFNLRAFQIALVLGIVALSYFDKDGWGWLVFILLLTI
jgi:hypothetical protein